MNPGAPAPSLPHVLRRRHRALAFGLALRGLLRLAAVLLAALALALAAGLVLPTAPATAWARLVAAGLAALATAAVLARQWRRRTPGWERFLEQVETRFPDLRSWLRNAVELDPARAVHTSAALAAALQREAAQRLAATPLGELDPRLEPARPLLGSGVALALGGLLLLASPQGTRRSWETLWDPGRAAPPVRLEVTPGDVRLSPGAALTIRAQVWGTPRAPSLAREAGAAPRAVAEGGRPDGGRLYRFELARLTRDDRYRVEVGRVRSPTYRILLSGEPVATSFEIEYVPPRYARLPAQRAASIRGDLTALRGTRARVTATFDRDLDALAARDPAGRAAAWTALTPRRWQGDLAVLQEGSYVLEASAPRGRAALRYRVTPLPDAPPVLAVRSPEGDLDLPAGQHIPLEAWGTDDLGLSELRLAIRKGDGPWTRLPLASFDGQPREAHFQGTWDASPLGLLPGQEAAFRLELADNCGLGGPQVTVSPTFVLRFPSLTELYDKLEQGQERREQTLESLAEQARDLHKTIERLARQSESAPSASFERREEVKKAAEDQRELLTKLEGVARDLRQSLDQAAERSAFDDQLMRKLQELADLMQQIQSPEFKDALRRMQEALQHLDRRAMEESLSELRDRQQELMAGLERTLELLRRLRQEEALQAAARRAEELLRRQQERNREMEGETPKGPSPLADAHRQDAQESRDLGQELDRLSEQAQQMGDRQSQQDLQQSAQDLGQDASPAQDQAASQLESGQQAQARQSGQRASSALQRAASRLREAADRMAQEMDQRALQGVRQAAQDLVSLSGESDESLSSGLEPRRLAERQRDLREGTARVADSLYSLARQTPFLSEDLARALGRAMGAFDRSERELSRGNRAGGEQEGRDAGEALNVAVLELRESEQSMCNNPGAGGRPTRQTLNGLSDQQGQLNRETRSLAQRLSEVMRLSVGDRDQLERLAQQQARIREGLEEVMQREEQKRELLGRLDQARREMKEVEDQLRHDPSDPSLGEKQERILSRMLDAQRSVNQRDLDPQRISRPGEDVARESPPPLPPELLRSADRARAALLKAEADRYPPQFRPFVEAYLRSLNRSPQ